MDQQVRRPRAGLFDVTAFLHRAPAPTPLYYYSAVKHGYVTKVRDWPHSRFHRFFAEETLPLDRGVDAGELVDAFGE